MTLLDKNAALAISDDKKRNIKEIDSMKAQLEYEILEDYENF